VPDGIANAGLDRVEMRMELTEAARASWQGSSPGDWTRRKPGGQPAPHLDPLRLGTNARRLSSYLLALIAAMTTRRLSLISVDR
jgi:hypothetical protein